jgi:hypothetical protein
LSSPFLVIIDASLQFPASLQKAVTLNYPCYPAVSEKSLLRLLDLRLIHTSLIHYLIGTFFHHQFLN